MKTEESEESNLPSARPGFSYNSLEHFCMSITEQQLQSSVMFLQKGSWQLRQLSFTSQIQVLFFVFLNYPNLNWACILVLIRLHYQYLFYSSLKPQPDSLMYAKDMLLV